MRTPNLPSSPFRKTGTNSNVLSRGSLMRLSRDEAKQYQAILNRREKEHLNSLWHQFAHPHQLEPPGDWTTWLMLGGRGAGKTRAGAEWVRGLATEKDARIALVGETEHDVREVMIEGVSGLLAAHPLSERPLWVPSRRLITWNSGAMAQAFSAEEPDSLRGPQFSHAWCDELAKWRYAEHAFDMLQFALRLGDRPRQLVTTTPRPIALLKRLIAELTTALTH